MEFESKFQIGDIVTAKSGCIQTNGNWFLKGDKLFVIDIKVIISMKSGEIEYEYVITRNKEIPNYPNGTVPEKWITKLEQSANA